MGLDVTAHLIHGVLIGWKNSEFVKSEVNRTYSRVSGRVPSSSPCQELTTKLNLYRTPTH